MQYQIHEMNLYSDFTETLLKIGHLPEVTVDNVIRQELRIRELESNLNVTNLELRIKELEKENEALKAAQK